MTGAYRLRSSRERFAGRVISVRSDLVVMPGGGTATRDVVRHPGAVGVVAVDSADRVVLVEQYRHPVGQRLLELPAGLLDVAGEPARDTAARELAEEAGLAARRWSVLVDGLTSPGMTDEAVRIYLAEELFPVHRPAGRDEEADLVVSELALTEAVSQVLDGRIRNLMAVVGILALAATRAGALALRPADADWVDRPGHGG